MVNIMKHNAKKQYVCLLIALISSFAYSKDAKEDLEIEVIEVTSRKKVESLQSIPDAVTAFSNVEIESARIDSVGDLASLTPNLTIREGFRAGVSYITMRGITTPQQGLPPVTFVVDDVQVGALDFINQDLDYIERIEVLRGPQGALYGAGAMAGAINIVTQQPTDEWSGNVSLALSEGNDKQVKAHTSGGLTDNWFAMFSGKVRKSDGLIDSAQGVDLDFNDTKTISTRWQYLLDDFTMDLRYAYADYEQGAIMQDLVPKDYNLDDFSGPGPQRSFIGRENRTFNQSSLKLSYDASYANFMWISSMQKVDQHLLGDLDWSEKPIFIQDLTDNFDVTSHEFRISSNQSDLDWLIGGYYQKRKGLNDLTIRTEPELGVVGDGFFSQIDKKTDEISALFSQISVDLTDNLELTLAARYDKVLYDTTRYTDRTFTEVVPLRDVNGHLTNTQKAEDSAFQPKVSLSYQLDNDTMVYTTYAEGFRPGFFNSGNLTKSEDTKNYEIGLKTSLLEGRGQLNGAIFYIDYSDQQFSNIIAEAPFRVTSNIPNTKIKGAELESIFLISKAIRLNIGYGHTSAQVEEYNQQAPATPKNTLNVGVLYETALNSTWQWQNRFDYRFQDSMTLGTLDVPLHIGNKNYLNVSSSLDHDKWRLTFYVENLTDEYTATEAGYVEGLLGTVTGVIRAYTPGRKTGISLLYRF